MTYQFESMRVLCVDDNKHMHQIYWISLASMGFKDVRFALDGGEALELMITGNFDLILCDLNMSPIDGLEFTKLVRKSKDSINPTIPIIIISGNTEIRNVRAARDAGANEFLAKPVSVQDLYKRIEAVIESPRDFASSASFTGPSRRRRYDIDRGTSERRTRN